MDLAEMDARIKDAEEPVLAFRRLVNQWKDSNGDGSFLLPLLQMAETIDQQLKPISDKLEKAQDRAVANGNVRLVDEIGRRMISLGSFQRKFYDDVLELSKADRRFHGYVDESKCSVGFAARSRSGTAGSSSSSSSADSRGSLRQMVEDYNRILRQEDRDPLIDELDDEIVREVVEARRTLRNPGGQPLRLIVETEKEISNIVHFRDPNSGPIRIVIGEKATNPAKLRRLAEQNGLPVE